MRGEIIEDQQFSDALELYKFLGTYSENELSSMYFVEGDYLAAKVIESTLSDASKVRDLVLTPVTPDE